MKFTVSREKLLEPLQLACGVVERRQTAPVLSNLLILAEKGQLDAEKPPGQKFEGADSVSTVVGKLRDEANVI